MTRHAPRILSFAVLGLCLLSIPLTAEEPSPVKPALAQTSITPTRVEWLPLADHKVLTLTVAGPEDFYLQREHRAGEAPSFSTLDFEDNLLPDGVYAYELRAEGEPVQSGQLWVQEGRFVDKPPKGAKPPIRNITAQETITNGDLIVPGQACIGGDCGSGDANGAALKLQEFGNLQIHFDSMGCCYPSENDWSIQATDVATQSPDFMIHDATAATTPFRIGKGAPDNSFSIFTNGNIGLGTSTPAVRLDVKANSAGQAAARLQNSSATGYSGTEYLDNAGNVDLFFGVDNAASATRLNSANNNPIFILTNGAERMRITSSLIYVPSGEVRIPGGTASANGWPTHFNWPLDGKNYIRGTTVIADDGGSVGIGTQSPSSRLHVNGGDIRVSGGSFIDDGTTLNVPDYVFEPDYRLMPLDELREFVAREKHLPNVPSAETVKKEGLNLSQVQMRLLEKLEELTLYTLKQDEQVKALQSENARLSARLEALEQANGTEQ